MPHAAQEKTRRQEDDRGAEAERRDAAEADEIEARADGGDEEDEIKSVP